MQFARQGTVPEMRQLKPKITSVDQVDAHGWSALMVAAYWGHVSVVQYLTRECRAKLDLRNADGDTALRLAQRREHQQVIGCLEACALNRNTRQTRWMQAIMHGDLAAVKQIMARADVEISTLVDKDGWTPLMMAAYAGHRDIVEFFASMSSVDIRQTNAGGETALSLAERMQHSEIVSLLTCRLRPSPPINRRTMPPKRHLPRRRGRNDSPNDSEAITQLKAELAECRADRDRLQVRLTETQHMLDEAQSQIEEMNRSSDQRSKSDDELADQLAASRAKALRLARKLGHRNGVIVALLVLVFGMLGAHQVLRKGHT
eukprot:c20038_g1_i3.p1 GENE.c20038_g1_i3~~c20038_g1_i3.p1  ORF type:complete len:317 (+),score=62.24 c20038_g1_i3:365-1315(+)